MADGNEGTTPQGGEAEQPAETTEQVVEQQSAAAPQEDVTTLRSRIAGLDAKVSTLSDSEKNALKARDEALQKLADYEAGKVGSDEALRAQLAAKDAELEAARREAQLARIEAQYPETYSVLGEAAANLSADKLAEAEARFKGVAAGETAATAAPKPIGNAPARTVEAPTGETSEDIFKRLQTMQVPT